MRKKIIIGTANFSGKYGFFNKKVKNKIKPNLILKNALDYNINKLDLAEVYFDIKKISKQIKYFNLILKIQIRKKFSKEEIIKKINEFINKAQKKRIYSLMLHESKNINSKNYCELIKVINQLKKEKKIKKFGISVYEVKEVNRFCSLIKPDIVQFPINIFDQSFLKKQYLKKMKKMGIELHARSIFLQGLLLKKKYPSFLKRIRPHWNKWHIWLKNNNINPLEACINMVNSIKEIDFIIVGIDNSDQLKKIVKIKKKILDFKNLEIKNKHLTKPIYWNN